MLTINKVRADHVIDFTYMEGECSKDEAISPYYDPDRASLLNSITQLCVREHELASKHLTMPTRNTQKIILN